MVDLRTVCSGYGCRFMVIECYFDAYAYVECYVDTCEQFMCDWIFDVLKVCGTGKLTSEKMDLH